MSEQFCPICGTKQQKQQAFCEVCGSKLDLVEEEMPISSDSPQQVVSEPHPSVQGGVPPIQQPAVQPSPQQSSSVQQSPSEPVYDWAGRPVESAPVGTSTSPEGMYVAPVQSAETKKQRPAKDVGTAVVGSIIVPGFFYFYLGEAVKGAIVLILVVLFASFNYSFLAFITYIGQLFLADYTVKEFNKRALLLRNRAQVQPPV